MTENQTVTVVVIGPTQNGKSTFINMARSLSKGNLPTAAGEGNGTESCTTSCEAKEMLIPLTTYKLVDPSSGKDIPIPDDEEEMFSTIWGKKRYQVVAVKSNEPPVRLRIIDTPGLDDSSGRDASHIQNVLRAIVKEPYITAVAFICNVNIAFSRGFQEVYDYYNQCMPNLMAPGALAIINTNFSVTTWQQKHERLSRENGGEFKESRSSRIAGALAASAATMGLSSKPKTSKDISMEERKKAFKKTFHRDPTHFFIDSKPDKRRPFELMVAQNSFVEILTFLSNKGNMPTGQMNLIKSTDMQDVDTELANLLFSAKNNWQIEQIGLQQLLENKGEKMVKARTNIAKRVAQATSNIENWTKELERLDNETEYPLKPDYTTHDDTSTANRVWKGATLRRFKGTRVITENLVPTFFVEAKCNDTTSRWTSAPTGPVSRKWTGEYEADWGKVPNLTARTYTYNKYWYAKPIEDLESNLARARIDLKEDKEALEIVEANDPDSDTAESKRIRLLTKLITEAESLLKELKEEKVPLDTGFDDAAQRRYKKFPSQVNHQDLMDLLKERCPELAAELMGVGWAGSK